MEDLQTNLVLPVICTRGMIVFPNNDLTLDVGRTKSLKAIEDAADIYDGNIVFVSQKDPAIEDPTFDQLFEIGTLCKIKKKIRRDSAGTIKLTVTGVDRVKLESLDEVKDTLYAKVMPLQDVLADTNEEVALVRSIAKNLESFMTSIPSIPMEVRNNLAKGVSSRRLSDTLAHYRPLSLEKKQHMLEVLDVINSRANRSGRS